MHWMKFSATALLERIADARASMTRTTWSQDLLPIVLQMSLKASLTLRQVWASQEIQSSKAFLLEQGFGDRYRQR